VAERRSVLWGLFALPSRRQGSLEALMEVLEVLWKVRRGEAYITEANLFTAVDSI